jgi:hypothetical protein
MKTDHYSWLSHLIGREADLDRLIGAYWDVVDAGGPQAVVLLAESGVGKTRLVRELYQQLHNRFDPVGYWPASFRGDLSTLDLNPDLTQQRELPVGTLPPYLWWPVRFLRPNMPNRAVVNQSALLDAAPDLLAHLAVVDQASILQDAQKKVLDLTIDGLIEVGLNTIPMAGLFKTCVVKVHEGMMLRKDLRQLQAAIQKPGGVAEYKAANQYQPLLDGLSAVMSQKDIDGDRERRNALVSRDLRIVGCRLVTVAGLVTLALYTPVDSMVGVVARILGRI